MSQFLLELPFFSKKIDLIFCAPLAPFKRRRLRFKNPFCSKKLHYISRNRFKHRSLQSPKFVPKTSEKVSNLEPKVSPLRTQIWNLTRFLLSIQITILDLKFWTISAALYFAADFTPKISSRPSPISAMTSYLRPLKLMVMGTEQEQVKFTLTWVTTKRWKFGNLVIQNSSLKNLGLLNFSKCLITFMSYSIAFSLLLKFSGCKKDI